VIDLSDWDRSTTINVPGESGQPGSPYYDNLYPLWADGKYHPMLFSREAIEKHSAHRLRLAPK
jgi:penicillin amidase